MRALRKSIENHIECAFRATHATESFRMTTFSVVEAPKWSPRCLRGASEGLLWLLWDPPGSQLDPLGAPLGPPWELRGRSWTLLVRPWRRFLSQIPETSPGGSVFPPFQLRLVRKTCEIQPKACENQCENLPAAPRLQRRIPTRVRRSREANSIIIKVV